MIKDSLWITWENQRRNRELSAALNIPLFEFAEIDEIKNYLLKYIIGFVKTFRLLIVKRTRVVCCQNPSVILCFLLIILKIFFDIRVVIDSHNAGLFPLEGRSKALNLISRFIQRFADLTIVTNRILKKHVEINGGRAFVLQDKIPDLMSSNIKGFKRKIQHTVCLYLCR